MKICVSIGDIMSAAIFKMLPGMLSKPVALLASMDLSNVLTSNSISENAKTRFVASRYETVSVFTSGMSAATFSPILAKPH